jgi:hypothetical protein
MRWLLVILLAAAAGGVVADSERQLGARGDLRASPMPRSIVSLDAVRDSTTAEQLPVVDERGRRESIEPVSSPPVGMRAITWKMAARPAIRPVTYGWAIGYEMQEFPGAVAAGDVTGDQLLDIVVTTASGVDGAWGTGLWGTCSISVFSRNASGTLELVANYPLAAECRPDFGGIALGDLNRDGVMDVAAATNDGIAVLASDGQGNLKVEYSRVGREMNQLGVMDVDRDGNLDVIGIGWGSANGSSIQATTIYYGDGAGGISESAAMPSPQRGYNDLAIGDVDSDGIPDLIIASGADVDFWVIRHNGVDGFLPPQPYPRPGGIWGTYSVAVGDMNFDGRKDVIVNTYANNPNAGVWVYAQEADGRLAPPARLATLDLPGELVIADLNGDRRDDLTVLHAGYDAVGSYVQLASGGLAAEVLDEDLAIPDEINPQGMVVVDVTGDRCPDVVFGRHDYGLIVMPREQCDVWSARTGGRLPALRHR